MVLSKEELDKLIAEAPRDAKDRIIIPDDVFHDNVKELPAGSISADGVYLKTQSGGVLKLLQKGSTELQSRGGYASGRALRERKTFAEALTIALDTKNKKTGKTYREEIADAVIAKAKKGNVGAFESIRDTVGEKPADAMSVDVVTPGDRELMEKLMRRMMRDVGNRESAE